MSELQKLIELQKIDSQLQEIRDLLGDLPTKVEELRAEEQTLVDNVSQGQNRLKEIEVEINKIKLLTAELNEKIDKYKNQLFKVTNNKQYDALMHEIDHLKEQLDQTETQEIELREERSQLEETTKSQSVNLESLQTDLHERMRKLEQMIAENDEQKTELEQQRTEQVTKISVSIMRRYDRIATARDGVAVVKLGNDACGGCGSRVPPQIAAEIKAGKGIHYCDVCSRFLYWTE